VIIHTAAVSDIDYCEAHQEIAESVNVGVTRTLVDLCAESDVRLIYFSSDSIFNGRKGRYVEEDIAEPLHFYGRTKVAGEKIVQQGCGNWVIIRLSLITRLPLLDSGNSFLWRLINELKQGKKAAFPKEEIRSPVDAVTFSRAVLELEDFVSTRYASYSKGIGKEIVEQKVGFKELEQYTLKQGAVQNSSGQQERLEGILNMYILAGEC